MPSPNPNRVAHAYRLQKGFVKSAGEVRFIKDRGGDKGEWAWNAPGPSERNIHENFVFNPKLLKPLALVLRSTLMALGHATSAHARLVKIKSRNVSPDGALGGQGYIQKIPDMRRQLMNSIEVLSSISDTIHDEINAPHWNPAEDTMSPRDREEVIEIVEQAEEIKGDPEGWAEEEEEEAGESSSGKTASLTVPQTLSVVRNSLANVNTRVQMLLKLAGALEKDFRTYQRDADFEDFLPGFRAEAQQLVKISDKLLKEAFDATAQANRSLVSRPDYGRVAARYAENNS